MDSKIIVQGIAAGIVIFIVSTALSIVFQAIFNYNVLALPGIRAANDPIMLLFFLHPLVLGFAVAILNCYTKGSFKGSELQKGKMLGLLAWVVYGIPSAFIVSTSMNYPAAFALNSIAGSFFSLIAAGITITKLSK